MKHVPKLSVKLANECTRQHYRIIKLVSIVKVQSSRPSSTNMSLMADLKSKSILLLSFSNGTKKWLKWRLWISNVVASFHIIIRCIHSLYGEVLEINTIVAVDCMYSRFHCGKECQDLFLIYIYIYIYFFFSRLNIINSIAICTFHIHKIKF